MLKMDGISQKRLVPSIIFRSVSECSECFCVNFLQKDIKNMVLTPLNIKNSGIPLVV